MIMILMFPKYIALTLIICLWLVITIGLVYRKHVELNNWIYNNDIHLWITISAEERFIEISWMRAPTQTGDYILLTRSEPRYFQRIVQSKLTPMFTETNCNAKCPQECWISANGPNDLLAVIQPTATDQRFYRTGVRFDYDLSENVTAYTSCYGYWASYINSSGNILAFTCIRAYPRLMHELANYVGDVRLRDLLIPGIYESGSSYSYSRYINHLFDRSICAQDDLIIDKLYHGARYLDIRLSFDKTRFKTYFIEYTQALYLYKIFAQVKQFIWETNEIVILGFNEFDFGYDKMDKHRNLVAFIMKELGALIVDPAMTWNATLNDLWARKQYVVLAYNEKKVVDEFPHILFESVEERSGNVQSTYLEAFLQHVNGRDFSGLSSRPSTTLDRELGSSSNPSTTLDRELDCSSNPKTTLDRELCLFREIYAELSNSSSFKSGVGKTERTHTKVFLSCMCSIVLLAWARCIIVSA